MDAKLKALKVPELKAVLAAAGVPLPSKANKADIIAAILASQPALDAYYALHEPEHAAVTTTKEPEPVVEEAASPPKTAEPAEPAAPAPAEDVAPAAVDVEAEKRKQRAARFGIPVVEPKAPKQKQSAPAKPAQDTEKLKSRAARFGITPAQQPPSKRKQAPEPEVDEEELARRKKRAERFGTAPKS